jgi:hypothetical protein
MRRREVLAVAVGLFVPIAVAAQEPGRTYKIGVVAPNARSLQTICDLTLPELARVEAGDEPLQVRPVLELGESEEPGLRAAVSAR